MFRSAFCLLSASLLAVSLHAQTPNPTITEMKAMHEQIKGNLLKLADKVPESDYSFKASPDIRTIGELLEHITQAQVHYCGLVSGDTKAPEFGSHSKADISAALKASFDNCDSAWNALTAANADEMTGSGRMSMSKFGALLRNLAHDNEEYGYLSVYLRIKGIVPPSSESMGRGRGRGQQ